MTLRILIAIALLSLPAAAQKRVVVKPKDTGAALINPGMGWNLHHYDNNIVRYGVDLAPSDTVDDFPGASVVYLRLAWSFVEPEEGRFDWAIVDTPAQRWIAKGKQVALRFTCAENSRSTPYATPEWVRKAGAKGHFYTSGKGADPEGSAWEPDYDDPVFLQKLDNFLAAVATRYDGSPEVAYIDIGSFGIWGEGHTGQSTKLPYSGATIRRHVDLHVKHFKKTLLVINDDHANHGRGIEAVLYARDRGVGLRDDSILVQGGENAYYKAWLAPMFWPTLPVIVESQHYGHAKDRDNSWGDGSMYLKSVEDYHASYATVHWYPREFYKANRDLVDRINMRLGYRLQLLEASWPEQVNAAGQFEVGYTWRNAGVAPCLPGGYPAITLKDEKGGIAGVFVDEEFDMRALPVGPPGQAQPIGREEQRVFHKQSSKPHARFRLPPASILKPGTYSMYISVGNRTGTPRLALPLADDDTQRRYKLGTIRVASPEGK
jgi:hypothetical protein